MTCSKKLAVITCLFNLNGSKRIPENYWTFRNSLGPEVPLFTVELVLDDDPVHVPDAFHVYGTREKHFCFQKECLLNIAMQRLPEEYNAVAWVDADILFPEDWYERASGLLEQNQVVQLFKTAKFLGEGGEVLETALNKPEGGSEGHCGLAWACHREVLDGLGLYSEEVLGGGDSSIYKAFAGFPTPNEADVKSRPWVLKRWVAWSKIIQSRVSAPIGYLDCEIKHLFHGSLKDRNYVTRHSINTVSKLKAEESYLDETGLRVVENPEFKRLFKDYYSLRNDDGMENKPVFVTSISPRNQGLQDTWKGFSGRVLDIQGGVAVKGRTLPRISDLVCEGRKHTPIVCLINDDIEVMPYRKYWSKILNRAAFSLVCVHRWDLPQEEPHLKGFDMFLLPPTLHIPHSDRFVIGECWWDWWIPCLAKKQGIPIVVADKRFILHQSHEKNWGQDSLKDNPLVREFGKDFKKWVLSKAEYL